MLKYLTLKKAEALKSIDVLHEYRNEKASRECLPLGI